MARNIIRRASGGIVRPPCAALPAKLTLMSLKADAHVMAWVSAPLDADTYVIFNPW